MRMQTEREGALACVAGKSEESRGNSWEDARQGKARRRQRTLTLDGPAFQVSQADDPLEDTSRAVAADFGIRGHGDDLRENRSKDGPNAVLHARLHVLPLLAYLFL